MVLNTLSSADVVASTKKLNYGTWRYQKTWSPLHIVDAEDCHFIDGAGKRYLDFSSQLMCVNLGHKNPAVIEAIAEQARTLRLHRAGLCHHSARAELSQLLLEVLPEGLVKFFFTTSGTEANEAAIKIARHVHRQDENHRAVSFLSRVDHGVHRRHGRSQAMAIGAGGERAGRHVRA